MENILIYIHYLLTYSCDNKFVIKSLIVAGTTVATFNPVHTWG